MDSRRERGGQRGPREKKTFGSPGVNEEPWGSMTAGRRLRAQSGGSVISALFFLSRQKKERT